MLWLAVQLTVMVDYVVEKTVHDLSRQQRRSIALKRTGPMAYTLGPRMLQLGFIEGRVQGERACLLRDVYCGLTAGAYVVCYGQ